MSNWVQESTSIFEKRRAEIALEKIKKSRYKDRKIKSIKYEQIPGIVPPAYREVIEYAD